MDDNQIRIYIESRYPQSVTGFSHQSSQQPSSQVVLPNSKKTNLQAGYDNFYVDVHPLANWVVLQNQGRTGTVRWLSGEVMEYIESLVLLVKPQKLIFFAFSKWGGSLHIVCIPFFQGRRKIGV